MKPVGKHAKKLWKGALAKIQNKKKAEQIKLPSPKDVKTDLPPYIQVLHDGTVKKSSDPKYSYDHPSETAGSYTTVLSKDIIISASTNLLVRIYLPQPRISNLRSARTANSTDWKRPIFVYYHGGGFFCDSATSINTHGYMNELVAQAGVIAVSVDYRLAPEKPLPIAFNDSWDALQWVASHAEEQQKGRLNFMEGINTVQQKLGLAGQNPSPNPSPRKDWLIKHGDFSKLYIGGDSTGGTIAHYLSSKAGTDSNPLAGGVQLLGTILCFPFFCDEWTNKKSTLYQMWELAYPNFPNGIDNTYINPFPKGPRDDSVQFRRMFVCYSEIDEYRDISARFVESMKEERSFSPNDLMEVSVTDEGCFHLSNPTSSRARDLILNIHAFISNSSKGR